MQMIIRGLFFIVLFLLAIAPVPAAAAPITFYGADVLAGPGDARPDSDEAAAAFDAALGGFDLMTFEGLPVGNFNTLEVSPGVSVTLTNTDASSIAGISNLDLHSAALGAGYNTTAGGENHLRVMPPYDSFLGGAVTFSFASPIDAFGAYLTDTETAFPGPITLTFFDGTNQVLSVPKTLLPGSSFFGFTDFGTEISSVSFNTGQTDFLRDIWGIDDVRFRTATTAPVPEAGTMLLLGAGLLGLAVFGRRRAFRSR